MSNHPVFYFPCGEEQFLNKSSMSSLKLLFPSFQVHHPIWKYLSSGDVSIAATVMQAPQFVVCTNDTNYLVHLGVRTECSSELLKLIENLQNFIKTY